MIGARGGPLVDAGGVVRLRRELRAGERPFTRADAWDDIVRRDLCVYCVVTSWPDFESNPITIEHVKPRSVGGSGHWWNRTGAHFGCNQMRSNRPLLAFFLFRYAMAELRGRQGTPVRRERNRLRRQFFSLHPERP